MKNYKDIPIFINSFNRPTFLMQLIYKLHSLGYENIHIIDNASTDPVTLAYLSICPYTVHRISENKGQNVIWTENILEKTDYAGKFYVYTDCDLYPVERCPDNFMQIFLEGHEKLQVDKVGFGLVHHNIPPHYSRQKDVMVWEDQFWKRKVIYHHLTYFYKAAIDTTFALYSPNSQFHSHNSLRTGYPYLATHLPWYENSSKPFFELNNYRSLSTPGINSWDSGGNKIESK